MEMELKNNVKNETFTNRYGKKFIFILNEDGNIQWNGEFKHCRYGFPNDYTKAYKAYLTFGGEMNLNEFKEEVHRQIYDGKTGKWLGQCDIARVYGPMVKSSMGVIDMVDPSGGPYLTAGMKIMGRVIKEFKPNEEGYLIITKTK
jgi:hypothetical protein